MVDNFVFNQETHKYEIVNNSMVDIAKKNLDKLALVDFVIANDDDLKRAKQHRTQINNAVKEVADQRKQMTSVMLAMFAPQCKDIESYGTELSNKITKKINEYVGVSKQKLFTLTITSDNIKALQKIVKTASKFQLEAKIKEKE